MYTLRVDCTPSLHTLVYDITKQVSKTQSKSVLHLHSYPLMFCVCMQIASPEEGEEGLSLYESWHKRDNWTNNRDGPRYSVSQSSLLYYIRLTNQHTR